MAARLLEGRPVADAIWAEVDAGVSRFAEMAGRPPTLALVSGADDAAAAYGRQIERQFVRHGLRVATSSSGAPDYLDHLRGLSADPGIDGILLLTPLPDGVSPEQAALAIDPVKDVDGQHPLNLGRLAQRRRGFAPATATGGIRLLKHYAVELRGARTVVVGRSPVVGMPLALMLIDADATVTVCHSRTADLAAVAREADLLCVAIGRAGFIGPDAVKPGAVVIDFGTNPQDDGRLLGDVQTDAVTDIASAVTPVPGGTGPTTVAVLAEHTLRAAELHRAG
ncbi:MAG: bifunctional 5,10-methylenetetrahydrofolate dehydrogenase/5,10-methenyltetrahydrofolate cyclohydrolase [Chloroflexi bacterium]|nr:bifunctional 5,10-methylenetetrahydrofolate dehydrogenase/5,10-methenyltetrahydrofolate cyclohydrolase [Chloroflexota bacterium]MBV9893011.1 bifunctional 5,10-methylenetetrahydrofolate dehydrogenase/5,10-methenyltetrahydrofolate cyclohydrolase [Chloroflexota bacterium]